MKQFLPILLMVLCYACSDQTPNEIPYTIIKGKIINGPISKRLSADDRTAIEEKRREIQLTSTATRSDLEAPNHHAITDDEGNYEFLIKIEKPTEIRLKYGFPINIPLYATPGDEIIVNIDHRDPTNDAKPYTIKGDNAAINEQITAYHRIFNDNFKVDLRATLPYVIPREFKEQRAAITEKIRIFTADFIRNFEVDNPIVLAWVKNHSEYRIAMDYMKYAFKTSRNYGYSNMLKDGFPLEYFDFWEEFPVNNPAAFSSLNYQYYLQLYRKYLQAQLAQTAPYQDCINLPNCDIFGLEIEQLKNHLEGKTLELTLSQQIDNHLIRNNERFLKDGYDQYLAAISDSLIIQEIENRKAYLYGERTFEYPDNVTFYQSSGTGEQILQEIKQKHQNKPTLLYFWNTQTDITYFFYQKSERKDLWRVLDSLNFDLVLLAHHSTPNDWKENVIENGFLQDQWHLTDEQYGFFENFYQQERKKHNFYDSIRDYENFILALDENGEMITPELRFLNLHFLVRQLKYMATKGQKMNFTDQ